MSTKIALSLALVGLMALVATEVSARPGRPAKPRGAVSGLEMGIEGTMEVPPGGRLRWYVTVYEIVGGRDLRPAVGTTLKALASFHRRAPVATATTDRFGRARIAFSLPETLEQSFKLIVEARSARGSKRRFDVEVRLAPRYRAELFVDRSRPAPGAALRAWGRVFDLVRNRPSPGHALRLRAKRANGALVGQERALRTDARGVFSATLSAPKATGRFRVEALATRAKPVRRDLVAAQAATRELVVLARPSKPVVRPGATIDVDVLVRRPDGRPVPRASLTGLSIPKPKDKDDEVQPVLTDERGRARVRWRVPRRGGDIADVSGTVRALREGIGTGRGQVRVRAARVPLVVSWAVEGRALVPGLPSRVFVKVQRADGTPAPGLKVSLKGGRSRATPRATDRAGVAVLDTTVASEDKRAPASCRGPTVAAATLQVGPLKKALCLPVDPDAMLRVRSAPRIRAGSKAEIRLLARPAVARFPVALTFFGKRSARWLPVNQTIVTQTGASRLVTLELPKDALGAILIRARPLVGKERQEIRGGTALFWSMAGPEGALRLRPEASGAMHLERSSGSRASSAFVLALPPARGEALLARLRRARGLRPAVGATEASWRGFLAARTPADRAVSAVLRGGQRVPLAMPKDAVAEGLLRDPWRSRARFVRGRLGRLLLAVEKRVAACIPDKLDDVAVRTRRGWRLNSEILTAVGQKLGIKAIVGLDGRALTIASLKALDSSLTFDNVARRITRKRQLRVLVALASFVRAKQLDYGWPRRKRPTSWLAALRDWKDPKGETTLHHADLFDAWGRPFALRKARGARARFRFLEPVVGYELLSAGPDGRFGTADDLYDPFARVLPKGSVYGEAVAEEALLVRLRGVALGRATLAALAEAFSVSAPYWDSSSSSASVSSWRGLTPLAPSPTSLSASPSGRGAFPAVGRFVSLEARASLKLSLSAQPRRYLVIAGAYESDGRAAFDARPLTAGAPVLMEASMPRRLRPREPLYVPVHVIGALQTSGSRQVEVRASGSGVLSVAIQGAGRFRLERGRLRTVQLKLEAARAGHGELRLEIFAGGRLLRRYHRRLLATPAGSLRAMHVGLLVEGQRQAKLALPRDARVIRSSLVLSAPRDLLRDPGFEGLRRAHPALFAWAHSVRGEAMSEALAAELSRRARGRDVSKLEGACAAVAWSARLAAEAARAEGEGDGKSVAAKRARDSRRELARALAGLGAAPKSLRQRAALLLALPAVNLGSSSRDRVAKLVRELRRDGWYAIKTERGRPSVMARLAAGLLLADRRDVPGRALFEAARKALVTAVGGGKLLPGEAGRAMDGWIGTAALAIAARQLGRAGLAQDLARGLAARLYFAQRSPEAAFWLLAASVYGAFGVHGPKAVEVDVDGVRGERTLKSGSLALALPKRGVSLALRSKRPVFARLEARYVRPVKKVDGMPLVATVEGHVGSVGDTAALEVVVTNSSPKAIARPVVEVMLPAAAILENAAIAALRRASALRRVERVDAQGLLRLHLTAIGAKQRRRLPLPLRWVAAGRLRGLSTVIYDADSPWQITSRAARTILLKARKKESWQ